MIVIYSEISSKRFEYVAKELLENMHNIKCELIYDIKEFSKYPTEGKICYSKEDKGIGIHIKPQGLLEKKDIRQLDIRIAGNGKDTKMFITECEFGMDIFSASFYMLTRYEEYIDTRRDQHGRYIAENSIATKNDFLEEPIVDIWTKKLIDQIETKFPGSTANRRKYRFVPTIDVDNIYAYRNKFPLITIYNLIKDAANGKWEFCKERLKAILRIADDPFFNLMEIAERHKHYGHETMMFLHCGCYGKNDKKTWLPSLSYMSTKRQLSKKICLGLHPSYRNAHSKAGLKIEKWAFEKTSGCTATKCRSHYLRFDITKDYKMLEELGFEHDYSMGYSNNPGFRAGTSIPFHYYDLKEERISVLTVHPLAVMDKTLRSNLGLTAEQAKNKIKELAQKVEETEGEFVTLFHNENQTKSAKFGWNGWIEMYDQILLELTHAK